MANQKHRLATQGELHRPERTGIGNPNRLTLDFLENGQYYQDVTTGAVYRFHIPEGDTNTANGSWELLIAYDRDLASITNIGASLTGSIVGITTEEISSDNATDFVSSIPAYMYTQLREGEDIRVIDSSNIANFASFTINSDVNAGIVNVEVQEMFLANPLPAQSSITVEGAIYTAYNSMDPTKIQLGVERRDLGDSIGTVSSNINSGTIGVTTIDLKDIDPTVSLEDNQKLVLKNRAGEFDIITANGAQNLEANTGTITVDSFTAVNDYFIDQAYLYEPSYGSSSRITLTSNSISLLTQQVSDVGNSVAGLNLYVQNNFASATLFAEFQDNTNTSISQLELNATAQQSSLELLSSFQTEATNALATINATTNAQGASISLLTQYTDEANSAFSSINSFAGATNSSISLLNGYTDGANTAFSSINTFASATNSSISILNGYTDGANTAFASINSTTNALGAELVLRVDSNGNVASVALGSDADGTSIDLNADQIAINNIEFNKDGGTIGSANYVADTSGWIINGNGDAEFNQIAVRNGVIKGGSIQDGATLSNLTITGELSMGTSGVITNDNDDFSITNDGVELESGLAGKTGLSLENTLTFKRASSNSGVIGAYNTGGTIADQFGVLYLAGGYNYSTQSATGTVLLEGTHLNFSPVGTTNVNSDMLVVDSSGDGMRLGIAPDTDFYLAPTTAYSADFNKEFRYDVAEDRWRSKVDLRTDVDLIYVGSLIDASDESIKENIESVGSTLDILSQIDPKEYDLIGASNVREFGFLAQDVEPFFPNLVKDIDYTHDDGTTETVKSLSYIQFIPLLVKAVQELKQQLDDRTGTT